MWGYMATIAVKRLSVQKPRDIGWVVETNALNTTDVFICSKGTHHCAVMDTAICTPWQPNVYRVTEQQMKLLHLCL